ncbi:DEAD/DEAH box helicase family protein [Baia soyae]|uniref:Type I restriction enzyme R subunit n=1 Tax=Baia soyae TaxID=1544746 RepID=A0A4R2RZP9_9BACL|nr:DEAD/DEAH box helicase family protein [Baia soyae]TCP70485.1 type I restriction enzyme R subunit [Baia soyae]
MTQNFSFLERNRLFVDFAAECLEAERSLIVSPATTAILSRRALELSVRWLYSHDSELKVPYQDKLGTLIHDVTFRKVIDTGLFYAVQYIWKLGNVAVHSNRTVTRGDAILSLRNLHQFVTWIEYCYADECSAKEFDESVLHIGEERALSKEQKELYRRLGEKDKRLEQAIQENAKLRDQLKEKRESNHRPYRFQPDLLTEKETREKYIDLELMLAGWTLGKDVVIEHKINKMGNTGRPGYADYVLFGDNGKPLAVIEAKSTSKDPRSGQEQARLYADGLEQQYGQRPVIFLSNGYDTYIWDDESYPKRKVSGVYTKDELMRMIERRTSRISLTRVEIKDEITNRYYQKEAIFRTCEAFEEKQRKALLVMATGSGKTRTVISLVDVLMRHNWVKNVLFLADRTALVRQAKRNFSSLLPDLPVCNLLEDKQQAEQSRVVFSTYKTMMNSIDEAQRQDGQRLFTVGHFDLIIVDESHRSLYKKFSAIFDYFDAMLVGLTATPKDEVDRNTYEVFELESGVPTYAYGLQQAIDDKHLVNYNTIETRLKFLEEGIVYDDLSEEEKEEFEEKMGHTDNIESGALNRWLFNRDTVDRVLHLLMEQGIRVAGGERIGKTIIFAQNRKHANFIRERFDLLFPKYKSLMARVIAHEVKNKEQLIDDFSVKEGNPHIAISVDLLDTGIDIPEVVNLVFFKKVRSKTKFWQMLGRGTRLCDNLFGPEQHKKGFLIFDCCSNFEFFRINARGKESKLSPRLSERLFLSKVNIIKELEHLRYQKEDYIRHRTQLIDECMDQILELNEDHFRVRQNLYFVHKYKRRPAWDSLDHVSIQELETYIVPMIGSTSDLESAKRFDALIYQIEQAKLSESNRNVNQLIRTVIDTAEKLAKRATISQVASQAGTLEIVQETDFWEVATLFELEEVRLSMRSLVQYLDKTEQRDYYTSFTDDLEIKEERAPISHDNDLRDYRKKVESYLKEHQDHTAVFKLYHNKELTNQDIESLERLLWEELGSKEDYQKEYGETPVMQLVRRTIGLDIKAANEAFSEFLSEHTLSAEQSHFVKLIVDYIVKNGWLNPADLSGDPFRSVGRIVQLFESRKEDAQKLVEIIWAINKRAGIDQGA